MNNINIDTDKKRRQRLSLLHSLLSALILLFFMTYIVCIDVPFYCYAVVPVYVLTALLLIRSRTVAFVTAIPCFIALITASSSPFFPLLLAITAAVGCGAFAIRYANRFFLLLVPIGAYAVAFALTENAVASLLVFAPVPGAIILFLAVRKGLSRTAAVASVAAVLVAIAALVLFLTIRLKYGNVTAKFFTDFLTSFRDKMIEKYIDAVKTAGLSHVMTTDKDVLRATVNLLIRLIPAGVVLVAEMVAYFSGLIAVSMHSVYFPEQPLSHEVLTFRMSGVSAVMFLLSFLASLLFSADSDTFGIVSVSAMNLNLILVPGLALCGILNFLANLRQRKQLSLIPMLLFLAVLIFYTAVIPYILAFSGAFAILRTGRNRRNDENGSL